MIQTENEKWMRRCLQLARCGAAHAAPNPMVGAVLVSGGRVVGEGYHRHAGGPHAEVNAIRSVADERLLTRSTLYVSLEPCSHYGKTPPCADLIISSGIPRVVVGCVDPFAQVQGRGIDKLRRAGIDVTVGVLENECRALNRAFFTLQQKGRPYVVLKWAVSADGYIGSADGRRTMLSTPHSLLDVHRLRAQCGAIMVGRRTAAQDDPQLNVRHWSGPNPLRVVIDARGKLPDDLHLFDGSQPTLVVSEQGFERPLPVDYFHPDFSRSIVPQVLQELGRRQINSLLVEGGRELLQSFIDSGLWDEARVELATAELHGGVEAPRLPAHLVPHRYVAWGVEHAVYHCR